MRLLRPLSFSHFSRFSWRLEYRQNVMHHLFARHHGMRTTPTLADTNADGLVMESQHDNVRCRSRWWKFWLGCQLQASRGTLHGGRQRQKAIRATTWIEFPRTNLLRFKDKRYRVSKSDSERMVDSQKRTRTREGGSAGLDPVACINTTTSKWVT